MCDSLPRKPQATRANCAASSIADLLLFATLGWPTLGCAGQLTVLLRHNNAVALDIASAAGKRACGPFGLIGARFDRLWRRPAPLAGLLIGLGPGDS